MTDKQETLADIVADMRGYAEAGQHLLDHFADRIEAAAKREIEARVKGAWEDADDIHDIHCRDCICNPTGCNYKVGNASKLRDALEKITTWADAGECEYGCENCVHDREEMAKAALAAPPRNCDVGTAREQAERWKTFCSAHYRADIEDWQCGCCPCGDEKSSADCEFEWGQLPYEAAQEGGDHADA